MNKDIKYAGFWIRLVASFADTVFMALPIGIVIYFLSDGSWFDFAQYQDNIKAALSGHAQKALTNMPKVDKTWDLINIIILMSISMIFWIRYNGATPGKRFVHIKIVDSKTFKEIDKRQALTRSIGYIASTFTFLIGFIIVAFRKDKRGLHDLLAGTVVIYEDID